MTSYALGADPAEGRTWVATGLGSSWSPGGADAFAAKVGLDRIEAAARACGVFLGRGHTASGQRGVRVSVTSGRWLVHPDLDRGGWHASSDHHPGGELELDHPADGAQQTSSHDIELPNERGERHVPTRAWGAFLAREPATD